MTVVPGYVHPRLELSFQTRTSSRPSTAAAILDLMGWRWYWSAQHSARPSGHVPHPESQAYLVCKAVASPAARSSSISITSNFRGNLIPNLDAAWDEIGYIQIGDNPGAGSRHWRGELPERVQAPSREGYPGILGMEHGQRPARAGGRARAVIEAYAAADAWS